ncbi:MAG: class I SAM-dependent methyltransferase [Desulfurivibrionaceae bacterium]
METEIRIDIDKRLHKEDQPVIIDIGCGQKKKPGRIGIDQFDLPEIDIVTDIEKGLSFLPQRSVDEIHCRSVLEHIHNFDFLLREIMRVLKEDGRAYVFVPHFSNPYYYSDPTHVRPFGLYTFYYYADFEHQLKRKVPNFYSDLRIQIISQKLVFRFEFALLGFLKKGLGRVINSCQWFQEYYEENLVYHLPAHGIEFVIGHPPQEKSSAENA